MNEDNMTQIFHNGQPGHGDEFNLTKGNPWFSNFLVLLPGNTSTMEVLSRDIGRIYFMLYL
jgi:hypothetical protein